MSRHIPARASYAAPVWMLGHLQLPRNPHIANTDSKNERNQLSLVIYRGRDARHRAPPAQIPAGAIRAPGSHLGCLTAKRLLGHG